MNFLFYLLGRAHRTTFSRPGPRQVALSHAAALAGAGDLSGALEHFQPLARGARATLSVAGHSTPIDLLICGHLHLSCGNHAAAHHDFSQGIDRLMARDGESEPREGAASPSSIEQLLSRAYEALRRGRYVRVSEILLQARVLLDVLLAAHCGLLLNDARESGTDGLAEHVLSSLLPLAKLSDITLRLLARAHLATHLSRSLKERQLREDLAPWAISAPSIDKLLEAEYQRLSAGAREHPGHAEIHYRLGLAARAAGHLEAAAKAFTRTLALHPHHVPSAARLVTTELQLNRALSLETLEKSFFIPVATLQTFGAFAHAASSPAGFDRAADRLCLLAPDDTAATAARANLAFALSELALLDPARESWREVAACPS
jgi:tetratricopeptide (TPR) repeat protein